MLLSAFMHSGDSDGIQGYWLCGSGLLSFGRVGDISKFGFLETIIYLI